VAEKPDGGFESIMHFGLFLVQSEDFARHDSLDFLSHLLDLLLVFQGEVRAVTLLGRGGLPTHPGGPLLVQSLERGHVAAFMGLLEADRGPLVEQPRGVRKLVHVQKGLREAAQVQ